MFSKKRFSPSAGSTDDLAAKAEKKLMTRSRIAAAGFGFMALNVAVVLGLNTAATQAGLVQTHTLAQETSSFLEESFKKFDNQAQGQDAEALQSLRDTAGTFAKFLPSDRVAIDDDLCREFMESEHISGLIILDAQGQVVAGTDTDGSRPIDMWQEVLDRPAVQDILQHPAKTYSDTVEVNGETYNFVALSYNGGIIASYKSLVTKSFDPYQYTAADIIAGNSFHKNPLVLISKDGEEITGSSEVSATKTSSASQEEAAQDFRQLAGVAEDWNAGELTRVVYRGSIYYGLRSSYKDYRFYLLYPASEVFSDRPIVMAIGLAIYLGVSVMILVMRGLGDRRSLEKLQKQLRIVNAISTTFETTFLLHLDTMTVEGLRMSEGTAKVFAEHPEPHDFLEHACRDLVSPESREAVAEMMDADTIEERLHGASYLSVDIKSGKNTWYALQIIPQRWDKDGKLIAVLVATRDVTAIKRAEELSFRDKLTGLRNRNYLESRGEELVRAGDRPVSVVMADCNYLKRTNDTMGHEWGDVLLQRVAGALRDAAGKDCLVMRIGGDEFLLVCPRTAEDAANAVVERARRLLAEASDDDLTLSVSFGVACVGEGDDVTSFDEAFRQADEAMYEEKRRIHAEREAQTLG